MQFRAQRLCRKVARHLTGCRLCCSLAGQPIGRPVGVHAPRCDRQNPGHKRQGSTAAGAGGAASHEAGRPHRAHQQRDGLPVSGAVHCACSGSAHAQPAHHAPAVAHPAVRTLMHTRVVDLPAALWLLPGPRRPPAPIAMYAVSKTALLGLTKGLAAELGPEGITVNCVAPGIVPTKFSAALVADPELVRGLTAVPISAGMAHRGVSLLRAFAAVPAWQLDSLCVSCVFRVFLCLSACRSACR